MLSTIFFNKQQIDRLNESGVGIKNITRDEIKNYLTETDWLNIFRITDTLLSKGNILYELGFPYSEGTSNYATPLRENSTDIYKLDFTNKVLNAICPDRNNIVVWLEDCDCSNTNDMIYKSQINIVKAMADVIGIAGVKNTTLFDRLFLRRVFFKNIWQKNLD